MTTFKAHGKFLITGEYLVLHGAQALALPLKKMLQTLEVTPHSDTFCWQATDQHHKVWLSVTLDQQLNVLSTNDSTKSSSLAEILRFIREQKPELFAKTLKFTTAMNFSPAWGIGSSSTFLSLLSQWAQVDVFKLQQKFFKGSGYDVACATQESPLIYQLQNQKPVITPVTWNPLFKDHLYFVYLGKKQNSREAMSDFKKKCSDSSSLEIEKINALTASFLNAQDLMSFEKLMQEHEAYLSKVLETPTVKEQRFPDFKGSIKSLGGWGGDFVLATSRTNPEDYFKSQNCPLIFKWDDLN